MPRAAEAQDSTVVFEDLRATPKGTIGLGLVGAELGLIIPSVSGLNKAWALAVFPIVGATGGALAGYFALDKPGRSKGSVAALVVGLAGVMPAILVTKASAKSGKITGSPPRRFGFEARRSKEPSRPPKPVPGFFVAPVRGFAWQPLAFLSPDRLCKTPKPCEWVASATERSCGFPSRRACFSVPS